MDEIQIDTNQLNLLVTILEEKGILLSYLGNHASPVAMLEPVSKKPIDAKMYETLKAQGALFNLDDIHFMMNKRIDKILEPKREANNRETSIQIATAVSKCFCREVHHGDVIMALYLLGMEPIFDPFNGLSFTARYNAKILPVIKRKTKSSFSSGFPEIP